MATLEICCNTEWLRECAGLDHSKIEEGYLDEAADFFASQLHAKLTIAGFNTERAKGQRILFHGWNGASTFGHKLGPVGTFDDLGNDQQKTIWDVIDAAREAATEAYAKPERQPITYIDHTGMYADDFTGLIQCDDSGRGHCWRTLDADDDSVVTAMEALADEFGEIVDGAQALGDNGIMYRAITERHDDE